MKKLFLFDLEYIIFSCSSGTSEVLLQKHWTNSKALSHLSIDLIAVQEYNTYSKVATSTSVFCRTSFISWSKKPPSSSIHLNLAKRQWRKHLKLLVDSLDTCFEMRNWFKSPVKNKIGVWWIYKYNNNKYNNNKYNNINNKYNNYKFNSNK